jgi:hypothetical protein
MMNTKSHLFGLLLSWICLMLTGNLFAGQAYYVAPDGNDEQAGSLERPWRTIEQAVSHMQPGETCFLRAGRYRESALIDRVQGQPDKPITLQAYANEEAIIDGTVPIQSTWSHFQAGIYRTQLAQPIWQLFVNDKSACSARWPNGNWDDGSVWDKAQALAWPEKQGSVFGTHVNRALSQFNFSLAGAIIIVNAGSFKTYASLVTQHAQGSDTLSYDRSRVPERQGYPATKHGYFLEGKLGFLDVENEWFYDTDTKWLYYRPPAGRRPRDLDMRGKVQSYGVTVRDSSYIVLKGLTFLGTTFRFMQSHHCKVEDCRLSYPSFSRRMLGDLSPMDITHMTVRREFDPAYNRLQNCVIAYADGPALEMNGVGNVVENNLIHHVDFSCTYKGGWTINTIDAPGLIFRRNTVHTTGASELFKAGRTNIIELNDLSRSGFLQNDGALIQISVKQQLGTVARYNWVHDSVKIGLRFDNSNRPGSPWGEGCRAHHNVVWHTDRSFFKGDRHAIHNNLCFGSKLNDLVISSDVKTNGRNDQTVTRNNIAGTFSGSRTKPGRDFPVPGTVDHNWSSDVTGLDIRTQLRDPDNLDFRPQATSELVDSGVLLEGYDFVYEGRAPDIGPYEAHASDYWIPGRQEKQTSRPIPPDMATQVKRDSDLMWLNAYRSQSHRVYWGTAKAKLKDAGQQIHNIYSPGPLQSNTTYYWRVDAIVGSETIPGPLWSFTTGSD